MAACLVTRGTARRGPNALMMLVPRRAKGLALTFPPTAKEALIGFILFDVSGIAFFGRIVVLLILPD
jgi:hypothetical protein